MDDGRMKKLVDHFLAWSHWNNSSFEFQSRIYEEYTFEYSLYWQLVILDLVTEKLYEKIIYRSMVNIIDVEYIFWSDDRIISSSFLSAIIIID